MVVDKTLTPSPWTTWTTHMDYPKMDYAAEVWVRKLNKSGSI